MLSIEFVDTKVIANGSVELKEEGYPTGWHTLTVIKNYLDSFQVTYTEGGVVYNQGKKQCLHFEDYPGVIVLGSESLEGEENNTQLSLESSPGLLRLLTDLKEMG